MQILNAYRVTAEDTHGKETTHFSRSPSIRESAKSAALYIAANRTGQLKSIDQVHPKTLRKIVGGEYAEMKTASLRGKNDVTFLLFGLESIANDKKSKPQKKGGTKTTNTIKTAKPKQIAKAAKATKPATLKTAKADASKDKPKPKRIHERNRSRKALGKSVDQITIDTAAQAPETVLLSDVEALREKWTADESRNDLGRSDLAMPYIPQ